MQLFVFFELFGPRLERKKVEMKVCKEMEDKLRKTLLAKISVL